MIICITGEPLSGKSTFARKLAVHLEDRYVLWSSGDYARQKGMQADEASIACSDLSLKLNDEINRYATTMLHEFDDVIIEGWPRSLEQAMVLDSTRQDYLVAFVFTDLPMQLERMCKRGREGDTLETVLQRSKAALRFHGQLVSHLPVRKLVPFTARGLEMNTVGSIECLESYLDG
jgi:adenylate kinase family enzyme